MSQTSILQSCPPRKRDELGLIRPPSQTCIPFSRSSQTYSGQSPPAATWTTSPESPSRYNDDIGPWTAAPAHNSAAIDTTTSESDTARRPVDGRSEADQPLKELWFEALDRFKREQDIDFLGPDALSFDSKDAILSYVARREEDECDKLKKSQWRKLRGRLIPLAGTVGKLCASDDEAVSRVFLPSKIIFSVLGFIVSAPIKVGEDLENIGEVFDEINRHLQVAEDVVSPHRKDLLYASPIKLLLKFLVVRGTMLRMWHDGNLRSWLNVLIDLRPLSEALQDLRELAAGPHGTIAAVTYETVTEMTARLADGRDSRHGLRQLIYDLLRTAHKTQEGLSLTMEDTVFNRSVLCHVETSLFRQIEDVERVKASDSLDKIVQWLECPDSSIKLSRLLDDRAEETGAWFLGSDVFTAFREGEIKSIWLSGKAGSGKSTLIAAAAQSLQAYCASSAPRSHVLTHLFDATDGSNARDIHTLLSSLTCQLALKAPRCASMVLNSYKTAGESGYTTKSQKEHLLLSLIRDTATRISIVIDALDEADDDDVFPFLRRLSWIPNISLLASCRPLKDINAAATFGTLIDIGGNEVDRDIAKLVDIATSPGGPLESIRDRANVRQRFLEVANGNLRWTNLAMHELRAVAGIPAKVRQRLNTLPGSLEAMYQRCLDAIAPCDRDDIRRLLLWLARSVAPLSMDDLAEIMSFDYMGDQPIHNASLRPAPESVINMVGSRLISVSHNVVRLAHASVRDYLLNLPPTAPFYICGRDDYALMARTSLGYLDAINDEETLIDRGSHLTWSWVYYVDKAGNDKDLMREVTAVVSKVAASTSSAAVLNKSLWTAAEVGRHQLVEVLLENGAEIDSADAKGRSPLHIAAMNGNCDVASLLLERGAAVDARDNHQDTPLVLASYFDRGDVARVLLDKAAHIEECDIDGWTPLHMAAQEGHLGIIHLLLERGASTCVRTAKRETPLMIAAFLGREDIVRLLLDEGAHINESNDSSQTSLHLAAEKGHLSIVSMLLERGASIFAQTIRQDTPLTIAARHGREGATRLLLARGAHTGDSDYAGWTSLHFSAMEGHLDIARLLLEHGASVTAETKQQATPLTIAAQSGHEGVVRLLLDYGAHIEECGGEGWSALHFAVAEDHIDVAKVLLERGASIAARSKSGDTPLTIAAKRSKVDVIRLLLDRGAHIEDNDMKGWTSLHFAAQNNHALITRLLLERGASIETLDSMHRTPLHRAACAGHIAIIDLLVNGGAALEARDAGGRTPLYLAVWHSQENAVEVLLARGSDPKTSADDGTTLLDIVGKSPSAARDVGTDARVRVLVQRAGCTEETGRVPSEDGGWSVDGRL